MCRYRSNFAARLLSKRTGETAAQSNQTVELRAHETVQLVLELQPAAAGGYAAADSQGRDFFGVDVLGLPGLLVSPARGLLVFSPFLVFIGVGLAQRLRTPSTRRLAVALGVAVAAQLLLYSQADWRAGVSWGPRWLADALPIMIWMLAPAPQALRKIEGMRCIAGQLK